MLRSAPRLCPVLCPQALVRSAVKDLQSLPHDELPAPQNCVDQLLSYVCVSRRTVLSRMRDDKARGSDPSLPAQCAEIVRCVARITPACLAYRIVRMCQPKSMRVSVCVCVCVYVCVMQ